MPLYDPPEVPRGCRPNLPIKRWVYVLKDGKRTMVVYAPEHWEAVKLLEKALLGVQVEAKNVIAESEADGRKWEQGVSGSVVYGVNKRKQ